jgi:glycosyltransferase involved in cell wall biosynthesis
VRFLGHVDSSEHVKELHCNCFAYIHGHSVGGTNPALLKALGYGNCVLALDNPFNREVVADCGILFGNDPSDLAKHLRRIEESPEEAANYRRKAPSRILAQYTWDHITDQYEDYFERLVRGEKPALDRQLGMYEPLNAAPSAVGAFGGA